jgi:hypothetical protein
MRSSGRPKGASAALCVVSFYDFLMFSITGTGVRRAKRGITPLGKSSTRQSLQPKEIGAVMEVTNRLKHPV